MQRTSGAALLSPDEASVGELTRGTLASDEEQVRRSRLLLLGECSSAGGLRST
jgi:hypothetical protein